MFVQSKFVRIPFVSAEKWGKILYYISCSDCLLLTDVIYCSLFHARQHSINDLLLVESSTRILSHLIIRSKQEIGYSSFLNTAKVKTYIIGLRRATATIRSQNSTTLHEHISKLWNRSLSKSWRQSVIAMTTILHIAIWNQRISLRRMAKMAKMVFMWNWQTLAWLPTRLSL